MKWQLLNPDSSVAWEYPTELEARYVASLLRGWTGSAFKVRKAERKITRPGPRCQAWQGEAALNDWGGMS